MKGAGFTHCGTYSMVSDGLIPPSTSNKGLNFNFAHLFRI
jgi:hypothetical protein